MDFSGSCLLATGNFSDQWRSGHAAKAPGKRTLEDFVAAHPDAVEHDFGHGSGRKQPRHINHQLGIGDKPLHVLAGVAGPILQVMEKTGGIEADPLPGIKPQGTPIALEGLKWWVSVDFGPQIIQAVMPTNFLN